MNEEINEEMENLEPHVRLSLEVSTFVAGKTSDPDVILHALELSLASIAVSLEVHKADVMANVSTLFDECLGVDEAFKVLDKLKKH